MKLERKKNKNDLDTSIFLQSDKAACPLIPHHGEKRQFVLFFQGGCVRKYGRKYANRQTALRVESARETSFSLPFLVLSIKDARRRLICVSLETFSERHVSPLFPRALPLA